MHFANPKAFARPLRKLLKSYLLSVTAGDIMLGEVADHLCVNDLDRGLSDKERIRAAADIGFTDTVDDAIENIWEDPEGLIPYSALCDLYDPEGLWKALMKEIEEHTHFYDASLVTKNPYYIHVHAPEAKSGAIELGTTDYLGGEFFQTYHQGYSAKRPFGYADIGFFDERVAFPVIREKGHVWMSVVMSEIESMEEPLARAHGKVITYGLGLGYYAFMAAEKKEVESVTVVEMNPHVISLFKTYLLPQFPHKEKIHIIEADAMDFIREQKDGAYDVAFADFWGGVSDGISLYLRFMPLTARFQRTLHEFWIESCFLEYHFRPVMLKVLLDMGLSYPLVLPETGQSERRIQKAFSRFLKQWDYTIETEEDLAYLLTNDCLIRLMHQFAIEYTRD